MEGNIRSEEILDERRMNLRNRKNRIAELEERSLNLREEERIAYEDGRVG